MSVVIRFNDGFQWEEFKSSIDKILSLEYPVDVTWDLRHLTRIPWELLSRQVHLMNKIQPKVKAHIKDTVVLLPNKEWKNTLKLLFSIVPPQTPVELKVEEKKLERTKRSRPALRGFFKSRSE